MGAFLYAERISAGWRFYLLWLVMGILGWLSGIALEFIIFQRINLFLAVPLSGAATGWVIGRHEPVWILFSIGTAIAWWLGFGISAQILGFMGLPTLADLALIGLFAGAFVGIPQWLILNSENKSIGWWWILFSALNHFLIFPAFITGAVLMRFVEPFDKYIYANENKQEDSPA